MRKISKGVVVLATVIALGGGATALAQGMSPSGAYGANGGMSGWGGGYGDPSASLAAQKAALALRPQQEAAWDAYAKAVQDGATQMQKIRDGIDPGRLGAMSWQDRQAYMGQMRDRQAAVQGGIAEAHLALTGVLDGAQRARLSSAGAFGGPGMGGPRGGPQMTSWSRGGMGRGMGGGWGMGSRGMGYGCPNATW